MYTKITYIRHDGAIEQRVFKGNEWVQFLIRTGYKQVSNDYLKELN